MMTDGSLQIICSNASINTCSSPLERAGFAASGGPEVTGTGSCVARWLSRVTSNLRGLSSTLQLHGTGKVLFATKSSFPPSHRLAKDPDVAWARDRMKLRCAAESLRDFCEHFGAAAL